MDFFINMNKVFTSSKGFTLLELLISMAIFAVLLGIVITGFLDTRKLETIKDAALQLESNIQKAQNNALTGVTTAGTVPIGGYGLHIQGCSSEYFLFADSVAVSTAGNCDAGTTLGNQRYDNVAGFSPQCNEQIVGSAIPLPSGVIILKIKNSAGTVISGPTTFDLSNPICNTNLQPVDITFKSPQRAPYLGWGSSAAVRLEGKAAFDSVDIYLFLSDKKVCRKVHVDGIMGQVTITSSPDCNT